MWRSFNDYIKMINQEQCEVKRYEDVFSVEGNRIISMLKVRVVQELIQIERPRGWIMENTRKLAFDLKRIEIYNSAAKHKIEETKGRWDLIK